MFFEQMHPTWQLWLSPYRSLLEEIEVKVLAEKALVPPTHQVMRAFQDDPKRIKVVLLGQDPYPTPGDAVGLAFAIDKDKPVPRSLSNIAKELYSDVGVIPLVGKYLDLKNWSQQGVLLLNRSLTTRVNEIGAHSKIGWDGFTLEALKALASHQNFVLMAWGSPAKKFGESIVLHSRVVMIESAHPSPLSASRGFFGSKPFSRTNQALQSLGLDHIDWSC